MVKNKYIEEFIKPCLEYLYEHESTLFDNDLSERCIAFRLAFHLQNMLIESIEYKEFLVDCDYNSSTVYDEESKEWVRRHGKPLEDREGDGATGRFIDIIAHTRSYNESPSNWSDLICFEIKKWNNIKAKGKDGVLLVEKDKNNLRKLTSDYGYEFGFHLILGKVKNETTIEVFQKGESLGEPFSLF